MPESQDAMVSAVRGGGDLASVCRLAAEAPDSLDAVGARRAHAAGAGRFGGRG
jgi:hypothetical protein